MARWLLASAALLLLAAATAAPLHVGNVAPDFRLMDQNSHIARLSAARGHKVVLVFYRGYW
jgi:peroxiredoxin